MFEILCVTSRALCREDFLTRLERLAAARPAGIILREKDRREKMVRALKDMAVPDASEKIYETLMGIMK